MASDERYRRAQAIVHDLFEAAPPERAARLAAACGADEALRREVEWLLTAAQTDSGEPGQPGGRLGQLAAHAQAMLGSGRVEAGIPHQYRLLEPLGTGGMGQVWLAERDDGGVRQRVALKLLRGASSATAGELARFIAEGRILARLNHPNIAHLLDASGTADGQPYLAMELVEGERVDLWCATHAPALEDRMAVFLKVCAAVEYAHAQLVIHRDLKPANILVNQAGEPKLLDFGIARLLDRGQASQATTVLNAMTIAYASPEQVRGETLGTATDIYSLGVVLYELVTGVRPFDHLSSEHERSNAIVSGQVTPPSRNTRDKAASDATASAPRHFPARRIPADIDAIVLKAMRREPEQRYASVAEFSTDLKNFLGARPVLARRGQRGYRARRFLWRNRWALAAATLVLAIATGFTWRTVLAEREARQQAATAERVTDFLSSIFAASDSNLNQNLREELSARDVLDAGTARIDAELAHEPRIRARLLEAVGNAYRHMNANNRAATLMRKAADLDLSPEVDDPLAAARCLEALANLLANGEFPASQAEAAARDSLEIVQRLTATDSQEIANAFMVLSLAQNRAGNYRAALVSARKTEAINLRLRHSPGNRLTAVYNNLCIILANRGELAAADHACDESLALHAAQGSADTLGAAMTLSRRAQVRAQLGEAAQADAAMAKALAISRASQGDSGPFTALFELRQAVILDDRGEYAQADAILARLLHTQARLNGADSGEHAAVELEQARRLLLLDQPDAAAPMLRDLVQRQAQRYGADDPRPLQAQELLAQALFDLDPNDARACAAAQAAVDGWASKDDPDVPAARAARATLARCMAPPGKPRSNMPVDHA